MSAAGPDPDSDPDAESESDRPERSRTASDVAERCRDAGLVRLVATADGDALAAAGLLARALSDRGVAFQASVREWDDGSGTGTDSTTDADATVAVGFPGGDVALTDEPLAVAAGAAARELSDADTAAVEVDPDPALALAGVKAAGAEPGTYVDLLEAAGVERGAGVAVPTDDLADGLAHATLVHTPFSGDPEAAAEALSGRDSDGRTVASLVALAAVDPGEADAGGDPASASDSDREASGSVPRRAATAVERALRPYRTPGSGAPFATLGGYADVLDAVARERPGVGVALAIRAGPGDGASDLREAALSAWRDHARRAHDAVRAAATARYDGLVVADVPSGTGAALPTAARLLRDYRSPEPVVVAREGGDLAVAGPEDREVARAAREAVDTDALDGRVAGRGARGRVRIDEDDREAFVAAFREVISP